MLKTEFFRLHLKTSDKIKVLDVKIQSDDEYVKRFSVLVDGEKIELAGDTESFFMKFFEKFGGKYEIHSCFTCRHGNFCPIGDCDNEIFCVKDFEPKGKSDLYFVTEDSAERQKRSRTLFDVCEDFKPCCDDYYTYK